MYEEIKKLAETIGFDQCGEIEGRLVPCDPTLRRFCEQNVCGEYKSCWMCPPAEGAVGTLVSQIHSCKKVLVFTREYECPDLTKYMDVQIAHERRSQMLWLSMQKLGYSKKNARVLSVGGCHLCEKCGYLTGEECRHPDMSCPSLSGYCVEVNKLAGLVGIDPNAKNGGMVFFCVVLLK